MSNIPSKSKLDEYVKMGLIRSQTDKALPLTIYVYSELTSFDRLWNSVTTLCRGLVVDDKGRCIVRCIPKFFNEDEPHALCYMPEYETPIAYNKLDGSLIQVSNDAEYGLVVTSKGSFASDQAKWARQIISQSYTDSDFEVGKTYIFELIHPENRIVLDYGDIRQLYLLAVINTETGAEYAVSSSQFSKFPKVKVVTNVEQHMQQMVEGIVVKTGSHRYKVKTGEYIRLHRIVTEFTKKRVWEAMSQDQSLEFANMPEEFDKWLQNTIDEIAANYIAIEASATSAYEHTKDWSDKELGLNNVIQYKDLVFQLRRDRDIKPLIYKMIKPKKEEIEDVATIDA